MVLCILNLIEFLFLFTLIFLHLENHFFRAAAQAGLSICENNTKFYVFSLPKTIESRLRNI